MRKNSVPHLPLGNLAGATGMGFQPSSVGSEPHVLPTKLVVLILAFMVELQGFSANIRFKYHFKY